MTIEATSLNTYDLFRNDLRSHTPLTSEESVAAFNHLHTFKGLISERDHRKGNKIFRRSPVEIAKIRLAALESSDNYALALESETISVQEELSELANAKRPLVEAFMGLVVKYAHKFSREDVDTMDLIQDGALGLDRALEVFDPTKNDAFIPYASGWVKGAMFRTITRNRSIHLPMEMELSLRSMRVSVDRLRQTLLREPTRVEIAADLEISVEDLEDLIAHNRSTLSLSNPFANSSKSTVQVFADFIPAVERSHVVEFLLAYSYEELYCAMSELDERHRHMIEDRFGLGESDEPMTFEKMGVKYGVSHTRIKQIVPQAIMNLRKKLIARDIQKEDLVIA